MIEVKKTTEATLTFDHPFVPLAARAGAIAIALVIQFIVLGKLDAYKLGYSYLILTVASIAALLVTLGANSVIVNYWISRGDRKQFIEVILSYRILVGGAVVGLTAVGALAVKQAAWFAIAVTAMLSAVLNASWVFQCAARESYYFLHLCVISIVQLTAVAVFLHEDSLPGFDIMLIHGPLALAGAIVTVQFAISQKVKISLFRAKTYAENLGPFRWTLALSAIGYGMYGLAPLLMARSCGVEAVGELRIVTAIGEVAQALVTVIPFVLQRRFAEAYSCQVSIRAFIRKVDIAAPFVALIAGIVVILTYPAISKMLLNNQFHSLEIPAAITVFSRILSLISLTRVMALQAAHEHTRIVSINIKILLSSLILHAILIHVWGVFGASIAMLVVELISATVYAAQRRWGKEYAANP